MSMESFQEPVTGALLQPPTSPPNSPRLLMCSGSRMESSFQAPRLPSPPPAQPQPQLSKQGMHKRNRQSDCLHDEGGDDSSSSDRRTLGSRAHGDLAVTGRRIAAAEPGGNHGPGNAKKPRETSLEPAAVAAATEARTTVIGFEPDECTDGCNESDSDYDDLDEFETVSDIDDDDDGDDDYAAEDDQSTTSSRTSLSTGSVGSNTPSLVGENLEAFSLNGETGGDKKKVQQWIGGPPVKVSQYPLRRSLFSHCPPAISIVHHNEVPELELLELRKLLRWKLSAITPAVVKRIVTNSGFRLMRKTCTEWSGTWGKHMKSYMFKDISVGQKINHFPGTFNIGRKDRLWRNYHKMKLKFPGEEFAFLPRTFCLPADARLLRKVWEKRGARSKWIVKPPALARGTGIVVVNKWSQIPKMRPLIVQKYLAKPHLINNTKYDLRIYVLLTSIHPLRIYLYDEGLVRFASNEYSRDPQTLSNVFMHLTNYSINKNSGSYCHNEDPDLRQGNKWTLHSLWQHLEEQGHDVRPIWQSIKDLVIKTIISAENPIQNLYRTSLSSHYNSYELFGFDVLLDSKLKPWLIEVNISPSLHSASPLDLEVKSPLATELFNIVRYHVPNKLSSKKQKEILAKLKMDETSSPLCFDRRLYARELSKADRAKQDRFSPPPTQETVTVSVDRKSYLQNILTTLTPDDVRHLIRAEDELTQTVRFARIFPTPDTFAYFKYFEKPRYYNFLFDAWENLYGDDRRAAGIDRLERLCQEKYHLKVPASFNAGKPPNPPIDVSVLKAPTDFPMAPTRDGGVHRHDACAPSTSSARGQSERAAPATSSARGGQSERAAVGDRPIGGGRAAGQTDRVPVKVSQIGVPASKLQRQPMFGGGCSGGAAAHHRKSSSSSSRANPRLSSPESMSVAGDSADGEKSRSPSPPASDNAELERRFTSPRLEERIILDNMTTKPTRKTRNTNEAGSEENLRTSPRESCAAPLIGSPINQSLIGSPTNQSLIGSPTNQSPIGSPTNQSESTTTSRREELDNEIAQSADANFNNEQR